MRVRRLLLVEDNEIAAEGIRMALEVSGYEVRILHDGEGVLEEISGWDPDVLILDVSLPGRDGVEVAGDVRGTSPSLPIIFTTGHQHVETMATLLDQTEIRVLRKPFELAVLLEAIEELCC